MTIVVLLRRSSVFNKQSVNWIRVSTGLDRSSFDNLCILPSLDIWKDHLVLRMNLVGICVNLSIIVSTVISKRLDLLF